MRLDQALQKAKRIAPKKPPLPAISNVLLSPTATGIRIRATDLKMDWGCTVKGSIDGEVLVNPGMLLPLVKGQAEPQITVDGQTVKIGGAMMRNGEPEDFPPMPTVEGERLDIPEGWRNRALEVGKAAATNDNRLRLCTLFWAPAEDTLAAADGFRLRIFGKVKKAKGYFIPATAIRYIPESVFGVVLSETRAQFFGEDEVLIVSLVQDNHPDYWTLLPDNPAWMVTADVKAMLEAVEGCKAIAKAGVKSNQMMAQNGAGCGYVRIVDIDSGVNVSAKAEGVGEVTYDVTAEVVRYNDKDMKIAVNVGHALQALNSLAKLGDRFSLEAASPTSPMVWRSETEVDWVEIIMPMFVKW